MSYEYAAQTSYRHGSEQSARCTTCREFSGWFVANEPARLINWTLTHTRLCTAKHEACT